MRVMSVRLAYETNSCLKEVAQSVAEAESGLSLELELSKQDAKLLVAEVNGSCEASQKKPPTARKAPAHKNAEPETKQPTAAAGLTQVDNTQSLCIHTA